MTRVCVQIVLGMLLALASVANARAETFVGTVAWIEVWSNGNIAFKISPSPTTCNTQFILNRSSDGTRNFYAALLSARTASLSLQIDTNGCGPAENYNPSVLYNSPAYIAILQ